MIDFLRQRAPIRLRLTLWYVFLMGITLTAFSVYLMLQFERSLQNSIDSSLEITVAKTIAALDEEDYAEIGKFIFDHKGNPQPVSNNFAMRIISSQGEVWDEYNAAGRVTDWGNGEAQYSTLGEWRVHNRPIIKSEGVILGWVQAAQSLQPIHRTMDDLRRQLLFALPAVLLLAGLGGYFLADRALRPVHQITRTAQSITGQELSKRIGYQGATDEIGRLARTFDQMLARLQDSFERERRFTSDAAHELRTPLTVLKGQIEVTLSRDRGIDEYKSRLRQLAVQVDRLIRLSNALLFLSRSDQNQIVLQPVSINLTELLCVLIEQFAPLVEEKKVYVSTQLAEDLFVHGDYDHIVRLFMNVLENAIKYTTAEGQVHVLATRQAGWVLVAIFNRCEGIAAEHIPQLFERFYRVDESRSSDIGGTGLGLAIAREIVRLHGGRIDVQSEMGKGVTVTMQLPAADPS